MSIEKEKDLEKVDVASIASNHVVASTPSGRLREGWERITRKLLTWGVESRGILPIPLDQRTDKPYSKIFFIWFSININILSFSAGTLGPVVFGLGLRDTCLTVLFFNMLCCAFPAYLATWGPKLGMRQMIISRYTFGYYGVILIGILNLIGIFGFVILGTILGGQTLASVANGNLSWSVGVVVIAIVSLLVSFCGYTVLNWYERITWIPVLITFLVVAGLGGKHLINPPPPVPATAPAILSFAATLAGFVITFSPLSSDFSSYYQPNVSSWGIFLSGYAGFLLPIITLQCLGAAVAIAATSVPLWNDAYAGGNVGGLLEAILSPVGNFGKFLTVLLSLSVIGGNAAALYSISINLQLFLPMWVAIIPRYVFSLVAMIVVIPISIVGAHRFYDTITNFLGLIGYWAAAYCAIIITEHLYFRRNDPSLYDLTAWNVPKRLPSGIAAVAAGVCSFAVVIPSMNQVWFTGPIGRSTGDIGFEVAFVVSGLLYFPFRWLEIRWRGFY